MRSCDHESPNLTKQWRNGLRVCEPIRSYSISGRSSVFTGKPEVVRAEQRHALLAAQDRQQKEAGGQGAEDGGACVSGDQAPDGLACPERALLRRAQRPGQQRAQDHYRQEHGQGRGGDDGQQVTAPAAAGLTRMSHRFTAADTDIPANPAGPPLRLRSVRVLLRAFPGAHPAGALRATRFAPGESVDVLSSTPTRPNCRAPCLYRHLRALASRIGEICGLSRRQRRRRAPRPY